MMEKLLTQPSTNRHDFSKLPILRLDNNHSTQCLADRLKKLQGHWRFLFVSIKHWKGIKHVSI